MGGPGSVGRLSAEALAVEPIGRGGPQVGHLDVGVGERDVVAGHSQGGVAQDAPEGEDVATGAEERDRRRVAQPMGVDASDSRPGGRPPDDLSDPSAVRGWPQKLTNRTCQLVSGRWRCT
jgi:hypothetical protein